MGYMRIYGLDVKDRLRTLNHATFLHMHTRAYTAYTHGAVIR